MSRPTLRYAIGFALFVSLLLPCGAALAADDRAEQIRLYDQVYRFVEGAKGRTAAKRYAHLIVRSAKQHGLHPLLVANIIRVESGYNPRAISPVGAVGLMQIMPFHFTQRRLPVSKWTDPEVNIDLGCRIFATYLGMMSKRYPQLDRAALRHRALVAYNMGPRAVVSRGIYRSRYSQQVYREGTLAAARTLAPIPRGTEEPKPFDWNPLSLPSQEPLVPFVGGDRLRVGYPLPDATFALPSEPSDAP